MIHWGDQCIGDQLLMTRKKPVIWRCHYPECACVISAATSTRLPQAVSDHLLYHYQLEVEVRSTRMTRTQLATVAIGSLVSILDGILAWWRA